MNYEVSPIIGSTFAKIVCPLITQALLSIELVCFDWRIYTEKPESPVSQFNGALALATERCVRVRAITSNESVKASLLALGIDAKRLHSQKLLHTKLIIIDEKTVIIGSHNFTESAFTSNEEASVVIKFPTSENAFRDYFEALWSNS